MHGLKIPLQGFCAKNVGGGLMCEGGRICGTLRYMFKILFFL